ncbi:MAG TPA: hypothetical protein PKO23_11475 [Candidatus Hydrogenedentes bacterium]|jgi:hypothetical protein|nr:hypothetical protein [Candidatus Hydrogenedentota bacterium]
MRRNGIIAATLVVMLVSMSFFAQSTVNASSEENGTDLYQPSSKDEEGVELDINLCGCRITRQPSGAVTGKYCGCTVLNVGKGDFFVVASAMMGLVALSARKK